MAKGQLIILLLLVNVLVAPAQRNEKAGWVPGYVVTNASDTLRGFVKRIDSPPFRVLDNVRYKESEDGKKKAFAPEEIKGFDADGRTFHPVKTPDRGSEYPGSLQFMELTVDGYVRVYRLYAAMATGQGMQSGYAHYLMKRGEKILFDPYAGVFKKRMSEYLSDNPALVEKIETKQYKGGDIEAIVIEYNKLKLE